MSPLQPQLPPQPAPMSPSRKKQIPGTLVLNWQPSERQAAKPVMRRPMTACEACRAAKVKCNGQNTCERCKTRGLRCSYSPALNAQNEAGQGIGHSRKSTRDRSGTTRSPSNGQVMPPTSLSTSQNQTQSDPMSVDMTGNPFAMAETSPEMLPFPQTNNLPQPNQNELEHWGEETFNNALEEFDWVFPSCLDVCHVSPNWRKRLPSSHANQFPSPRQTPARTDWTFCTPQPRQSARRQTPNATPHPSKRPPTPPNLHHSPAPRITANAVST